MKKNLLIYLVLPGFVINNFISTVVFADPEVVASARHATGIDGVPVEAVEEFPSQKSNELSFEAGIFPFNPYYYGLSIGAGYTYYFNNTFGWEVVHATQYFAVDSGLTSQLADKYQVNPQSIQTVNFTASSDLVYAFAYGKFAFFKDYIRYFRADVLLGPGMASSNVATNLAVDFGIRVDFFTGETFVWKFEARDTLCFGGVGNILSFSLGTGIRF